MRGVLFLAVGLSLALATPVPGGMSPTMQIPVHPVDLNGTLYLNNAYSALCIKCHERNPSGGTLDNTGLGSHFVWGGADNLTRNKSWERLNAWPSGALSKYGKTGDTISITGSQGELICESCHRATDAAAAYLLIVPDNAASASSILCEGCHGTTGAGHHPLTGETVGITGQPLNNADGASIRNPPLEGSGAFYPGEDQMSCWSCHKVHDASTKAGARILHPGYRSPGTGSPGETVLGLGADGMERQYNIDPAGAQRLVTDFAPLCDACHRASD